ncbi:hypothetical protein LMB42_04145 [Limosilactobacillus reuteri]|uniref:hypothetical protein n=1 Tax=Limosilactobacillus reuteri TaxID=1598 RepID=UPI001E31AFBE|nr:hypothetical protein [Limosilactobacillus reuteri]MCC4323443.1 hypothetical protein [Limosilactobacillus reuteri]MCC4333799.1 hypothetical protein [Limosilactobacillus reuteri]
MDISNNIAQQYNINGLLQALRDELQPITDEAIKRSELNKEKAFSIAYEVVRSTPTIESLLAVLTQLTQAQLDDLLKKDGESK